MYTVNAGMDMDRFEEFFGALAQAAAEIANDIEDVDEALALAREIDATHLDADAVAHVIDGCRDVRDAGWAAQVVDAMGVTRLDLTTLDIEDGDLRCETAHQSGRTLAGKAKQAERRTGHRCWMYRDTFCARRRF